MTLYLTDEFVQKASWEPFVYNVGEREFTLRSTKERQASLAIYENEQLVGFVTPYARDQYGVVNERFFGRVAPPIFRTFDDGVAELT